jgi:hemerythrin
MDWKPQYSVGHAHIDSQHKKLFDLVNEVADKVKSGNMPEVKEVIDRLANYTVEHFRDEEKLMQKAGYPRFEDHRLIHVELIEQVQALQLKLMKGEPVSMIGVIRFLSDWLKDHILKDDMDYKPSVEGVK